MAKRATGLFDDAVSGAISSPDERYSGEKKKYEFPFAGFQQSWPISLPQSMTLNLPLSIFLAIVLPPYPLFLMLRSRQIWILGLLRNQAVEPVQ